MILYTIMYKQAIINSLIKCATGAPTADDYAAYIALTNDLGNSLSTPRIKGMPLSTVTNPLDYSVDMSDKTLRGKPTVTVNPSDPASVSLLLGRAANDYNAILLPENNLWNRGYTMGTVGRTLDLLKSFGDNKKSWEGIQKAYKDHPEILKDFEYLRDKRISAKLKYDLASTLPGLALGGYLGYKFFNGKGNIFNKKKHPILHYLTKGVKGVTGFALGNLIALGASHMLGIPQHYRRMYEQAINDPSYTYRSKRLNENINRLH